LNRVRGLTVQVAYTPISSTVKQCKLDGGPAQGYEFVVAFAAPTNSCKFCSKFLPDFGLQAPATLLRAYILAALRLASATVYTGRGYTMIYWQPLPVCITSIDLRLVYILL
jgi:hypothetical protein